MPEVSSPRRIALSENGLPRMWLAVVFILLFFFLAIDSLVDDSPTMDEQNHIARGLVYLRTGDPRFNLEHPPLINTLSALPLLTMPELRLPLDHPSWERREGWYEFADLFLWQYNHDVSRVVFMARLPIVLLALALGLAGYRFAMSIWGPFAGLAALALLLFEPNLMAHGRYSTTDIGGTLFTFLTTIMLWRLWRYSTKWHWRLWVAATVCMGLAFGSKLSALGFAPIWILLAVVPLYGNGNRKYRRAMFRRLGQLALAGLSALLIVWVIYGFEWGPYHFVTERFLALNRGSGPMPTFWEGLEQIAFLGSEGRAIAFLLGRFSADGWAYYFPAAFVVKTPIVILFLVPLATLMLVRMKATRLRATFLLILPLAYYLFLAQSALNIGYRHALPALPYLLVLVSGLAASELRVSSSLWLAPRAWLAGGVAIVVGLALWIHPHYLSYFNVLVGGPANGYRVLTDSNVDWGQDLLRLKEWMAEHHVDKVNLGWFGSADPDYYGLSYRPMPGLGRDQFFRLWWEPPFEPDNPAPGIYAISASSIWEPPLRVEEKRIYAWFRDRKPDWRVGYSILIYDVR